MSGIHVKRYVYMCVYIYIFGYYGEVLSLGPVNTVMGEQNVHGVVLTVYMQSHILHKYYVKK